MDCHDVKDAILEALATTAPAGESPEIAAHLAGCAECATFSVRQRAVDSQLTAGLIAPALSASFRSTLRARIRREQRRVWLDMAPDLVHFGSCATATALCAVLVPLNTMVILGSGAAISFLTYIALTTVRDSLDNDG